MPHTTTLSTAFLLSSLLLLNLLLTPVECSPEPKNHPKSRQQSESHHHKHHSHRSGRKNHSRQQVDSEDYGSELYNPNTNLLGLNISSAITLSVTREATSSGKKYNLTLNSAGTKFFDDWNFFSESDPTHGLVTYQPVADAWKHGLVSVGPSSLDTSLITAKMKVDNTSWLATGEGRKSVRLTSKKSFKYGLLVLDAIKMPFGCSTWPAFWTVGNNWPQDGEIDIVEGVNMLNTNQMTVHSGPGCAITNPMSQSAVGNVLNTDCDVNASSNLGCGVHDRSNASYGQPFNQQGGGVFAMEWSSSGISIWRFARGEVPKDLQSGTTPQPSTWTIRPSAHWSSNVCSNMNDKFSEHNIIFDITLCGDWAGSAGVFNANNACSGTCTDLVKDPTNYDNANWEIASVKLYQ
ncbi:hypothetical protein PCANC_00258 [Puccinia coronata f. sp. avenae]|uniref:GH16 domain-containing protein n=1 Tax=Puccinia coronata f. sp. avenae TaxID=200324 RepID=A0A2N5W9C2_9BASI|nr:hypothetical protein PCANC_00258 [Puccinia coronata f. sp. avenae]